MHLDEGGPSEQSSSSPSNILGGRETQNEEPVRGFTSESERVVNKNKKNMSTNGNEVKRRSYESSKTLVAETERVLSLARSLEKTKADLKHSRAENEQLRILLLEGINGGKEDFKKYGNIPLTQLLRIRLEELEDARIDSSSTNSSFFSTTKKTTRGFCRGSSSSMPHPTGQNKQKKHGVASPTKTEVRDICNCEHLKKEVEKMAERSRRDREVKNKLTKNLEETRSEVCTLSECIEKLSNNLKHESSAKAKALSERCKLQRDLEIVKQRNQMVERKNEQNEKTIFDLNENSEQLKDQLNQMEKKCTDLRTKLDSTRAQMEKLIRRKDEEMKDLRLQKLSAEKNTKKGMVQNPNRKIENDNTVITLNRKRRALKGIYASEVWRLLPSTANEIT